MPSAAPGEVRDADGRPPTAVAEFPGAQAAVFEAGSGVHEFIGPSHLPPPA